MTSNMFNYLLPPHLLQQYCHHIFRRNFVSQSERNRNIVTYVTGLTVPDMELRIRLSRHVTKQDSSTQM